MEAVGRWRIIGVVGMLGTATPDELSAGIKGAVEVADPFGWRTYEEATWGGIYCRPARPFAHRVHALCVSDVPAKLN